jgi:prepilin-type N-terminal cleavage/methylation domain-containing protein
VPHPAHLPPRRAAFTLIELSIVLVIIGLLVGGLAGLRSYTRNAQLTTVMNESKILISAYNQFQTRYNAPPGDFCSGTCGTEASDQPSAVWPTAPNNARNGDGNGLIRAASTAFPKERYYAFRHLALGGFIQGRYTGVANAGGGATIGENVQGSSMDKVAFLFDHPDETSGFVVHATVANALYFDGMYPNILRIAGLNDNATSIPDVPFLTGKQALQIDEKFDDGTPGKGSIVTPKSSGLANCASSDVTASATYVTTSDTKTCYLFVRIQ